ncbi:MAG: response regulator [Vulcanimicrobiota bacterium]
MANSQWRILVVDDSPENGRILEAQLGSIGEVNAVQTGEKALELARSEPQPDLILLEVRLPDLSGHQVCNQLKSDPFTRHIPIIFLAEANDQLDEEKGLKLGAADYLLKPLRASLVRARVQHHLELKEYREGPREGGNEAMLLLLSALQRSSLTPLLTCDSQAMITGASPAFSQLLNQSESMAGKSLWHVLPDAQSEELRQLLALHQAEPALLSWRLPQHPDWHIQIARAGQGFLMLAEKVDPQGLERAHDGWLERESTRIKSQFLANLSHEIRAPLNVVSGMTYLLAQTPLDRTQAEYHQNLQGGVSQLRQVVNQVMNFSDADLAQLELRPCQFRLAALVDGLIQQLAARAAEKEVELVSRIDTDVPANFWGDPVRLNQLFHALVENGIKFAAGGRVSLSVARHDEQNLQFKILDSGIGMTRDQLAGLLESFAVANAATGLIMARRLVQRMNGCLQIDSQPGQGTLVTVTLPHQPPQAPLQDQLKRPGGTGERVLLVEDSPVNQRIVVEMLSQAGIPVDVADNGKIAIEKCLSCGPDMPWKLILMDLQMPEMDGYTATRRLRQESRLNDVPILAMSSHVLGEERARCREAGMDDFVFKPIDPEAWNQVLSQWLPLPPLRSGQSVPALAHIDTDAGMRTCGGNQEFYKSLLLEFAERCRQSIWELEAAQQTHDQERIKFIAHSLHGISANLGAGEIARECQTLLQNPQLDPKNLTIQLNLLAETLPAQLAPARSPGHGPWNPQLLAATRAAIATLAHHLEHGLGDSLDSVQDLISIARPLADQLAPLERLVNQFDFSAALTELQAIEEKLPPQEPATP